MKTSDGTYISFWPSDKNTTNFLGKEGKPLKADGAFSDGLATDVHSEERKPDSVIEIVGLNEGKIKAWFEGFSSSTRTWEAMGQNCAKTVMDGLTVGGVDSTKYELNAGRGQSIGAWTPNDVRDLANWHNSGSPGLSTQQWMENLNNMATNPRF